MKKALVTVGLPVFKGREIVWLALESLCRQETFLPWELIIVEEQEPNTVNADKFYGKYRKRLEKAGCVRLKIEKLTDWMPLPKKWQLIGNLADPSSQLFLLQAADCYSYWRRINDQFQYYFTRDASWIQDVGGFFYSIRTGQMLQFYIGEFKTGLDMALPTASMRNLPDSDLKSGIDNWLFQISQQRSDGPVMSMPLRTWQGLDTHGANHITGRNHFFDEPLPPFYETNWKLDMLDLPGEVISRLKVMAADQPKRKVIVEPFNPKP